ncbi:MAG: Bax inhibitor-1/YccA family protein [Nocardioides sp.]
MQSNNPVFRRSEEFNRAGASSQTYTGYGNPATWSNGQPGQQSAPQGYEGYGQTPQAPTSTGPMTIDTVVQKTAISLGVVIITALATWILTPDISLSNTDLAPLFAALTVGSLGAFALSMVNSFKREISPALVLLFCAFEGVALGALSKVFDAQFADPIVVQAVMGTFAAFAGTLAAYKYFNIKVSAKFQMFVIAAMFGMVGLGLMEMVLSLFNANVGLFGFGTLGLLMSVAGLVLGIFMLILDFDFVEKGVANGIPEKESWRAAFAMTVSLVWIYTNLLRILAILQQD